MIEAVWIVFAFSLGMGVRLIGLPPLIGYLAAGFSIAASAVLAAKVLEGKLAEQVLKRAQQQDAP